MGQYEPDDSRDVTLRANAAPGEPPRTGPREQDARRKAGSEQGDSAKTGSADGNSRDKDGLREADMAERKQDGGKKPASQSIGEQVTDVVGKTSDNPNIRARADANRPLYEGPDR